MPLVQALRVIAALSVALTHVAIDAITAGRGPSGLISPVVHFMP